MNLTGEPRISTRLRRPRVLARQRRAAALRRASRLPRSKGPGARPTGTARAGPRCPGARGSAGALCRVVRRERRGRAHAQVTDRREQGRCRQCERALRSEGAKSVPSSISAAAARSSPWDAPSSGRRNRSTCAMPASGRPDSSSSRPSASRPRNAALRPPGRPAPASRGPLPRRLAPTRPHPPARGRPRSGRCAKARSPCQREADAEARNMGCDGDPAGRGRLPSSELGSEPQAAPEPRRARRRCRVRGCERRRTGSRPGCPWRRDGA